MKIGIEHIAVLAKDPKALADWYVKMLGFEIVYDNGKGCYFVKAEGGMMLEIFGCDTEIAPTGTGAWGMRHIALSVACENCFNDAVTMMKEAGVEVITDVVTSASGVKTFFFRDPEGNILHFIYRPTPLC